jgi:hypothetical protein
MVPLETVIISLLQLDLFVARGILCKPQGYTVFGSVKDFKRVRNFVETVSYQEFIFSNKSVTECLGRLLSFAAS